MFCFSLSLAFKLLFRILASLRLVVVVCFFYCCRFNCFATFGAFFKSASTAASVRPAAIVVSVAGIVHVCRFYCLPFLSFCFGFVRLLFSRSISSFVRFRIVRFYLLLFVELHPSDTLKQPMVAAAKTAIATIHHRHGQHQHH